jgi:hypothetical protein
MYLDALEFLEEERDTWRPFERLADLSDAQLVVPVAAAHGWSGRDLMAHLLAWQGIALQVATELAVNETSPTIARDADWEARGGRSSTPRSTRRGRRPHGTCATDSGRSRRTPRVPHGRPETRCLLPSTAHDP